MLTIMILSFVALLGGVLSRKDLVPVSVKGVLHKYVYFFAAPIAIIYALGTHEYDGSSQYIAFLGLNAVVYVTLFVAAYTFLKFKKVNRKNGSVIAFSSNTPNTVFLGFPLVLALFGQEAFLYAALIGSLLDAALNAFRLFMLQKYTKQRLKRSSDKGRQLMAIVQGIIVNPFFVALCIGAALSVFAVPVPGALQWIGLSASYAALFALGLSVGHLRIKKSDFSNIILTSSLKLIVLPLAMLLPTHFLLETTARDASVFIAALPTAVLSLIVAHNMKLNEKLAASVILATTVLSTISLTVWYVVLKIILV